MCQCKLYKSSSFLIIMEQKNRIFATVNADGVMETAPSIDYAIKKFHTFKDKPINQRIDAVVELDERDNVVRYIISNIEHGIEVCPHCGGESSMHSEFRAQHCTECGEIILPCHLCECANCKECPLKGENRKYIGGIKPDQSDCLNN